MLNIKSPEAHRLARELADIEGTTLTQAVTDALRARLREHGQERARRRQVLDALILSARAEHVNHVGAAFDELYDPQTGLPR